MVRSDDARLFLVATVIAVVIGVVRLRWVPGRTIGWVTVAASVVVAVVLGRRWIDDLPSESSITVRWALLVAWGVVVGIGAARASHRDATGLALPGLCAAAGIGVWAGVPETSYALIGVGVIAGLTISSRLVAGILQPSGAAAFAVLPAVAGCLGAGKFDQALVGAMLATAPLALLAVVPVRRGPHGLAVLGSVALAVACGVSAGRLVGVHRTWDGVVLAAGLCTLLAVASVGVYGWADPDE